MSDNYPDDIQDVPGSPIFCGPDYNEKTKMYSLNGVVLTQEEYEEHMSEKRETLRRLLNGFKRR